LGKNANLYARFLLNGIPRTSFVPLVLAALVLAVAVARAHARSITAARLVTVRPGAPFCPAAVRLVAGTVRAGSVFAFLALGSLFPSSADVFVALAHARLLARFALALGPVAPVAAL
jgi:hypothetical protein